MALLETAVLVPVRGQFIGERGASLAGETVLFTPRAKVRKHNADLFTLFSRSIRVTLDALGRMETELTATDDPDVTPFEWTWQVKEEWLGGRTYDIPIPAKDALYGIDLTKVAPEPASSGVGWEIGPPGPPGPKGEPGEVRPRWYHGEGPPPAVIPGAHPDDLYLDLTTGDVYTLT